MSNERPIIFSGDMVRAILAGRKTMTRRIVKPQPPEGGGITASSGGWVYVDCNGDALGPAYCPYAAPRLWVRERWRVERRGALLLRNPHSTGLLLDYAADPGTPLLSAVPAQYRTQAEHYAEVCGKWRPSIHMPRWASRITLEGVSVRAERLQDISPCDILAEGVGDIYKAPEQLRPMFACLWDSINAKRGYPWAANPVVWVIEFRKVES